MRWVYLASVIPRLAFGTWEVNTVLLVVVSLGNQIARAETRQRMIEKVERGSTKLYCMMFGAAAE